MKKTGMLSAGLLCASLAMSANAAPAAGPEASQATDAQQRNVVVRCFVNGRAVDPKECPRPPAPPIPPVPVMDGLPPLPQVPSLPPMADLPQPPALPSLPPKPPKPPKPELPAIPELPKVPDELHKFCEGKAAGESLEISVENAWTMRGVCREENGRKTFSMRSLTHQ